LSGVAIYLQTLDKANVMFVEGKVRHSALFTNLVGGHASAVSVPPSDVISAQLAYDVMFCHAMTHLSIKTRCTTIQAGSCFDHK
jgi:hypothetical protein